jgi:hypothetical protein
MTTFGTLIYFADSFEVTFCIEEYIVLDTKSKIEETILMYPNIS